MKLVQLAEALDVEGVLRELGDLTPEDRAAHAEALEGRRATLRGDWWEHPEQVRAAQLAAELGCRTDPVAAAEWLLRSENAVEWSGLPLGGRWLLDVLNLYPAGWRAELAEQLASKGWERSDLVEHLVLDTGCPVPTTDEFVISWLNSRHPGRTHPACLRGGAKPGATLLERLRADDLSPILLPLVVERPRVDLEVTWFHGYLSHHGLPCVRESTRLGVLISLSAEGLVDRATLIRRVFAELAARDADKISDLDAALALTELALTPAECACLASERTALAEPLRAQLLQEGTRNETAPPLAFLRALALTPDENAPHVRDHVALLDLSLPVATYAQEVLNEVDAAGLLEPDLLTEVCVRVLLRPEKKLVRAQLAQLDRAVGEDPARAARTVLDAATAFEHRDVDVQERALGLVARHLRAAGDSVLPELRTAAARINPGLAAQAAEILGTAPDKLTEPYADVLPAVPEPRLVPDPIETPVELAEELAAVVANDRDVATFERVLDGLVRHAHLDRSALAQALQPVMRKKPRLTAQECTQSDVYDVAAALRGDEPRRDHFAERAKYVHSSPAATLLNARLVEAIDIIEAGVQPFLLAVPTDSTGALDAAVLVQRISAHDALGVQPAPVDLAQALLRVTPTADEKVLDAAGRLASDAGQGLARWLHEGGLLPFDSRPASWPECHEHGSVDIEVSYMVAKPVPGLPLLPAAAAVIRNEYMNLSDPMVPFWLAQLPHHRDIVIARDYFQHRNSERGWAYALPFAAESGGPAGFALHMALAYGLSYDRQDERDAAVDALLVLASREQLNPGLLGQQLAEMMRHRHIEANRVTASLRTAAETGAYATIWAVLEAALPYLLRDPVVRGTGALLALGVECASRCAAKGEILEVTTVAARTGSSQVVKNARLLRDALG